MSHALSSIVQVLACTSCRAGGLKMDSEGGSIRCLSCNRAYPVINGVVCFVPEELAAFSEVEPARRESFLAAKRMAYFNRSFISRMYNHYHAYAARQRLSSGGQGITVDIGCGVGEHYPFITAEEVAAGSFVGIDLDRFKLEHFHSCHPELPLLQASVFDLPFGDGSVDVIQLLATLEHFHPAEIGRVLDETLRILKPGGLLIVCYPAEGSLLLRICQLLMHTLIRLRTGFNLEREDSHCHHATAAEVHKAIADRVELKQEDGTCYPFGCDWILLALFVNETYIKL